MATAYQTDEERARVRRIAALGKLARRVALGPTGRFHIAAWRALDAAGIEVVALNPQRARRFAEAIGKLAKTDAVDARVLALAAARLGAAASPPPPTEKMCRIRELHAQRQALVAERVALGNRAHRIRRTMETPVACGVRKYRHGWAVFRNSERISAIFACERDADHASTQAAWGPDPRIPEREAS